MNEQPPLVSVAKTSGLAIASLVLGILSMCSGFLTGIPALILGVIALSKISKSTGMLKGQGLAVTGLCTGGLGLIVGTAFLAGLLLPAIMRSRTSAIKATNIAALTDIKAFTAAINLYELDNGACPTTQQGLQALVERPSNCPNWKGPYIDGGKIKNDPWGRPYIYRCPGLRNTTGFDLSSLGRDGKEDTDDDVGNW